MSAEFKFTDYPEGYNEALKLLVNVPEEYRAEYLDSLVTFIVNN